jgi:hypothetical protein
MLLKFNEMTSLPYLFSNQFQIFLCNITLKNMRQNASMLAGMLFAKVSKNNWNRCKTRHATLDFLFLTLVSIINANLLTAGFCRRRCDLGCTLDAEFVRSEGGRTPSEASRSFAGVAGNENEAHERF